MPTKISWAEESWNPSAGCSKVSPGCDNCYAEKMAKRLAYMELAEWPDKGKKYISVVDMENFCWNGKIYLDHEALKKPLHWRKPRKVFVCSMGDLFHKDVGRCFIAKTLDVAYRAYINNGHIFQFLTKRLNRMAKEVTLWGHLRGISVRKCDGFWFGATTENQKWADIRIPDLLRTPAAVRFVSAEPLLEPIDFEQNNFIEAGLSDKFANWLNELDWVIIGVERLPGNMAGRFNGEWIRTKKQHEAFYDAVRRIIDQCRDAGVAVFVKQIPIKGKVVTDIEKFPDEFQIREYPESEVRMSRDIGAMFFIPKAVKKAIEKHGQELVEGVIVQELQFHLDDLTPRKLNKIIKEAKAENIQKAR